MELQGKIIAVLPERSGVSARGEWKSQDFVIETNDTQYPRKMVFTVFGADRLQRFNIQAGMDAQVSFDIDAHEWQGRWFNDIRAFDVRPIIPGQQPAQGVQFAQPAAAPAQAPVADAPAPAPAAPFEEAAEGGADNLPF